MVFEANITFLRERKARYLVGTPKSWPPLQVDPSDRLAARPRANPA